jgi:hypothetical protein
MSSIPVCCVASDTKLETPEGGLTMSSLASKPAALLTRTDAREIRFAMIKNVVKIGAAQPVVRIRLSNGGALRVGPAQVLYKRGMIEAAASTLQAGDELDALFSFPDGYSYTSDDGQPLTSRASVIVTAVEPAGEADVFAFDVNRIGRFLFSAGVLGKANGI